MPDETHTPAIDAALALLERLTRARERHPDDNPPGARLPISRPVERDELARVAAAARAELATLDPGRVVLGAAAVCEGRATSLRRDSRDHHAAGEAGKCASAIRCYETAPHLLAALADDPAAAAPRSRPVRAGSPAAPSPARLAGDAHGGAA
jgi:hypothetical protein